MPHLKEYFYYHMYKLRASLCYTLFYFKRPQLRPLFTPSTDQAIALNTLASIYVQSGVVFCTFCVHTNVSFP